MIVALWAAAAAACDPLPEQLVRAQAALDDAEVAQAKEILSRAYASLSCQTEVVGTDALRTLFRLDGVVELAADDKNAAVYAVLRAVAVDPIDGFDPAREGPELFALYQTWAARLGPARVRVSASPDQEAWLDGRPVRADAPLEVAQGEHLVQIRSASGFESRIAEISTDLHLGAASPVVGPPPPPAPADPASPPSTRRRDWPSTVAWVGGALVGAAGGGVIAWGGAREAAFVAHPFDADAYGGCARADACYPDARATAIQQSAQQVRWTYLTGYGLAGGGGALFLCGLTGALVHTRF